MNKNCGRGPGNSVQKSRMSSSPKRKYTGWSWEHSANEQYRNTAKVSSTRIKKNIVQLMQKMAGGVKGNKK